MKLKTELTMKQYIRTNIMIFILWTLFFTATILLIGESINLTGIGIELVIYYALLYSLILSKSYLKLLITKKFVSNLILIIFSIILILCLHLFISDINLKNHLFNNSVENIRENLIIIGFFFISINLVLLPTLINLIFIEKTKIILKAIANFITLNIVFILIIYLNMITYNTYFINILLVIFFIIYYSFSLVYQKKLERNYIFKILNLEKNKILNNEIFIYGSLINLTLFLIAAAIIYIGIISRYFETIFIYLALGIIIIIKLIKSFIRDKIFELNRKYIVIEIIFYLIFAYIMFLDTDHYGYKYEYKFFTTPVIYIYLDMFIMRRIYSKEWFSLKNVPLEIKLISGNVIILMIVMMFKDYSEFVIIGLRYILPILILIEKIKEFKEIKEVDEEDIY